MPWVTHYPSTPLFVADWHSIARNSGRQIDWDVVPETYKNGTEYTVQVNDADASLGDTTLGVDALSVALPAGTVLDFGALAADAQTVTTTAQANAAATSIAVVALTVAIPTGTILDFTGAGEYAKVTADAAVGATSLTVEALDAQIESGDTASYPGVAQRQLVKLSAAAAAAATSVTVYPLTGPVVDNATAIFVTGSTGQKEIVAGTVMCQLSSGKIVPRVVRPGSEEARGLLMTSAQEDNRADAKTGYGMIVGGVIYEDLLPETITSYKTELETNGTSWVWETYSDSREV